MSGWVVADRTRRPVPAAVLAALGALVLTCVVAIPAAAHARLLETDPADGAVLAGAPAELTLTFDEPVQLRADSVRVFDDAGTELDTSAQAVDTEVVVAMPPDMPDGTYVVSWRVVSIDTHPVAGGFAFSVGAPSEAAAATPSPTASRGVTLTTAAVNAVAYLGVLAAAGIIAFQVLLLPVGLQCGPLLRRLRSWVAAGALAAVASLIALLPLTSARQDGSDLTALAEPSAWTGQLTADPGLAAALTAVGLGAALFATRPAYLRAPHRAGALAGAALAVGSLAVVGHTRSFGPAWLVLSSDLLHVVTAAVWFGGLIGLFVVLSGARTLRPSGPGAATAPAVLRPNPDEAGVLVARFSTAAAVLVTLLVLAGVVLGWRIVGTWSALFGTGYGVTLLVKAAFGGLVIVVAGYNRFRLLPRLRSAGDWTPLRRTVRVEAGVIVAVLATTGWLVNQDPLDEQPRAADSEQPAGLTFEEPFGEGVAQLRITPGDVGVNTVELELTDGDGVPLEPLEAPRIQLSLPASDLGPFERPVTRTGPGTYQATGDFALAGDWVVEIGVRLSRFSEPVVEIPVEMR